MIHWRNWQTTDLEDNACEAVDLINEETKYFYRAVKTATETE